LLQLPDEDNENDVEPVTDSDDDSRSSLDSTAEYEAACGYDVDSSGSSSFDSTAEYEAALEDNWPSTPARTPEAVETLFAFDGDDQTSRAEQQQQQQQPEEALTRFPTTPWNRPPEQLTTPTNGNCDTRF